VRANVLPGDIRDELLVSVRLTVENKSTFPPLNPDPEPFRGQEYSELQRHVEARQPVLAVELGAGQVMDGKPTLFDDREDRVDTNLAAIIYFKGAANAKATMDHGEHNRPEQRPVGIIERTIDENAGLVIAEATISLCVPHSFRGSPAELPPRRSMSDPSWAVESRPPSIGRRHRANDTARCFLRRLFHAWP